MHGGIGEVVNTPDCGSGTHGFDPHISPHVEKKSKDFKIEIDSYESIFFIINFFSKWAKYGTILEKYWM